MAIIAQTDAYLAVLRSLIESEQVLQKHGYTTRPLTEEELLLKRRCLGCGKSMSQLVKMESNRSGNRIMNTASLTVPLNTDPLLPTRTSPSTVSTLGGSIPYRPTTSPVPILTSRCYYHPGKVIQKQWSCCSQRISAQPCGGSDTHNPRSYTPGELIKQYQLHKTPEAPCEGSDIRAAVSIDCEMGVAASGDSELIRVTMIDYFSEEVLVNNIVEPDVRMKHLNTRYSGVSWADVSYAKRQKTCLKGKAQARRALWKYIGPETVVIGHGASNDLRSLRWIHRLVVDSYVAEYGIMKREEPENQDMQQTTTGAKREGNRNTVKNGETSAIHMPADTSRRYGEKMAKTQGTTGRRPGNLSLKTLVKMYLGRDIQIGGKLGHDSLEDAIAARDLVHWIITNPEHR